MDRSLRVLVAEDAATNRLLILGLLERLGTTPRVVNDGAEALATALAEPFDLILMDVLMPNLDGIAATRGILSGLPPSRAPRIVAVTANARPEDRAACREAGMLGFIGKPVTMDALAGVLATTDRLPD